MSELPYPKVTLIIPYFGTLPTYFPIFLRSCAFNPAFTFLLIMDRCPPYSLPENVSFVQMTLGQIRERAEQALGFRVSLRRPYKLCDFKPVYGVLFADLLSNCDYWGHCDLDIVFGDLRRFFTPDLYRTYPKIQISGHFSLYRNCEEMNFLFKKPTPGLDYQKILRTPRNYAFDEWNGVWRIVNYYRIPYYLEWKAIADTNPDRFRLKIHAKYDARYQVFVWDRGRLYQKAVVDDRLIEREFAYIHLQKRPMKIESEHPEAILSWMITPRKFLPFERTEITAEVIRRSSKDSFWWNLARQVTRPYRRVRRHIREIADTVNECVSRK